MLRKAKVGGRADANQTLSGTKATSLILPIVWSTINRGRFFADDVRWMRGISTCCRQIDGVADVTRGWQSAGGSTIRDAGNEVTMDPITTIIAALVAGASEAVKPLVGEMLKDAYKGLKTVIQSRYAKVSLAQLEEAPDSQARRAVVAEDLVKAGADKDAELLQHAKAILDAVAAQAQTGSDLIGLDIGKIKTGSMTLEDIVSAGAACGSGKPRSPAISWRRELERG
jgi:hypothetical protein